MQIFELKKIKDCEGMLKTTPTKADYATTIDQDTLFTHNGKTVGLYMKIDKPLAAVLRRACLSTKYVKTYRANALPTQSSVFGALPRVALRNDYCRFSAQTKKEAGNANAVFKFMPYLTNIYKQYLPEQYNRDMSVISENVNSDYRLQDKAPFTTANINVNHAIKYHKDTGNFRGNLSNVLVLKNGVIGGELVFPEYGYALEQADGYLSIFDGQSIIHGVMPIKKTNDNPYRASIVFYTLESMKHCYPYKMEVARLQGVSTKRANRRAENLDPRTVNKAVANNGLNSDKRATQ